MNYIWGMDLSLANTGIAIFDLDTYTPIHITSIKTNKDHTRGQRLNAIGKAIQLLKEQYPPYDIAIEQGFSKFNRETHALQNVLGIVLYIFSEFEPTLYAPTSIKATIVKGNASKDLVRKKVLQVYPDIQFKDNDQSDATAIAMTMLIKKYKMPYKK